ncbi:ATPase, AAA family [Necator americanus]|uniref:ATPase, AAA family n=1 Tax=Necator americanus TaxID=51031 RepID=W2TLS2_NECAM|nr:ATPase, AAA family [Necator americanus]ETN82086.1 ATPase, AAA family [Necator americanus]
MIRRMDVADLLMSCHTYVHKYLNEVMSMSDIYCADEELYDSLSSFSSALGETAKHGKNANREEIIELTSDSDQKIEAGSMKSDVLMEQKDFHNSQNTSTGSSRMSPSLADSNNNSSRKEEELDNFAASRRQAIESTILRDLDNIPKFSDIAGLAEAKSALFEALVDPFQYPEWFKSSDLKPWKAVLLYGPPGTGKSVLSQAIVRESNSLLYQVSSSDLISTWSGQSERLIRELFDHAIAQKKTAVIFIDEVDSLCKTRSAGEDDANRRVKTELLVQLQRLQSTSNIVLVCATNCPWDLDPAFLRRFEKKIYVGLPDFEARLAMITQRLSNTTMESVVSKEWIADMTNGFSGDDIRRFASELAYTQFRYYKESMQHNAGNNFRRPLSRQDIETVLASFSPSVNEHHLARFEEYRNK